MKYKKYFTKSELCNAFTTCFRSTKDGIRNMNSKRKTKTKLLIIAYLYINITII